jgi:hypothetical protein
MRHVRPDIANDSVLRWLTAEVIAYRITRPRRPAMTLEIKGLKANMMKVQQRIERLNAKAVAFDELGASVEQGLDDITAQVKSHGEDMTFAATVLGNSATPSGQSGSPVVEQPTFPDKTL